MPCCKGATLQIAHGLVMHHATMPPHEELWTSASPLHSSPVLVPGAPLGCKLGRLWRMPCSKGAKPQRAHGLVMHHAIMPPHEELWTSAWPLHSSLVLFHGALLGCKLRRLWRIPCSKGAKPQRAHGLAMRHAILPPHEELWTSAPFCGRGEDAGGWLRPRRKGPPAMIGAYI